MIKLSRKKILEEIENLKRQPQTIVIQTNGNVYHNENNEYYISRIFGLNESKYFNELNFDKNIINGLWELFNQGYYIISDYQIAYASGVYGNTCQVFKFMLKNENNFKILYLYY